MIFCARATRAMEDQSAPILEERMSEFGESICMCGDPLQECPVFPLPSNLCKNATALVPVTLDYAFNGT